MTTDREQLIEKAAKALTGLTEAEWGIATAEGSDHLIGYFDAAERVWAVFEEAHTPTDGERAVLWEIIDSERRGWQRIGSGLTSDLRDRILAAGFRRTVQGEPSHEGHSFCDPRLGCVQGEPTDAQVLAGLNAQWRTERQQAKYPEREPAPDLSFFGDSMTERMRAALRAAATVQGEPTDPNQIPDAVADAAQIAFHEFAWGDEPIGRLSVSRQGWKVAIAAALDATREGAA